MRRRGASRTTEGRARRGALLAALAVAAGWTAPALACPVCYGEASGGVIDGTKLSVAFLGGLVYLLLFGGIGMAVAVRRRALRTMDPRHGLRLIEGAAARAAGPQPMGHETPAQEPTAHETAAQEPTAQEPPAGHDTERSHPAAPQETSER